jgi:hypothetical protein
MINYYMVYARLYDLAPRPPHPPPYPVSKLDHLLTGGRGEVGGRGAESSDRKKAWSSINQSILSDLRYPQNKLSGVPGGAA